MTRWNKKKYVIVFANGETKETELTDKQFENSKKNADMIGAIISPFTFHPNHPSAHKIRRQP